MDCVVVVKNAFFDRLVNYPVSLTLTADTPTSIDSLFTMRSLRCFGLCVLLMYVPFVGQNVVQSTLFDSQFSNRGTFFHGTHS